MSATANLSWNPALGVNSYKVEYKLQSDSSFTLFAATVSTNSIPVTGLVEGSAYDFRVTSTCGSGSASGVIISGSTPCKDITGLVVNFAGTTANLSWAKKTSDISSAVSYGVEYKLQSDSSFTTASGSPLTNAGQPDPVAFAIPGLNPGTAYDFRVKVNCVSGTSAGAVVSSTSSCLNATNLAVNFT